MKKPGCNKCCVPFYCSLTNYECKRSTVNTLLMTETADVLFSLLISLGRVPLIKKRLFGRGGGGGDTSVNFYRVCTTGLSNYSVANY